MTYQEDSDYYGTLYDKDKFNPNATYQRKGEDMTAPTLNSTLNNQNNDAYVDLTGWDMNPNMNSFANAVNNKLKSAFGIDDLNAFKAKYPDQYSNLIQSLKSVAGTWWALDPSQRQLLDGQLQAIIWTAVGAGSDTSKLNVLNESFMNKFQDGEKVAQDMQNIVRLQTEGLSTKQIAKQMGISEDQVQQAILAYNWLDNRLWEYYKLKSTEADKITEPYDIKMDRLEQEKQIQLDRANRQIERLKEDFDKNLDRQKKANEINEHNADFISGQYWFGFSKRWIEWLNYVTEQAKMIIDDMVTNYDRSNQQMADWVADILRNWERDNEDLLKASEDALTQAKNNYTANMLAIQQQYGTVGMQAQQQMANNVQAFITQAENIYDNALTRQQQNLSNLITNFSNLNALQYSNLTLRNAKIQQFQNEAMTMNRNQLQTLAQQLGMSQEEFGDLANYQLQAVANELNGYVPWAWLQFQDKIQNLLNSWYTPSQVLSNIMNSAEFKSATASSWASNEWASAGSGVIYNKATWDLKTASGKTVTTTSDSWNFKRVDLQETPNVDTWIKNVYGSTVKLSPTVWAMFTEAYNALAAKWIELKVWDSYRSYETQKKAYESWKAWVVSPDKSFHCKGQAFDVVQDGSMYTDEVVQALLDAGFTRPNAKEPRHWSYGEWKDAFGGKPRNTDAYAMAEAILNGTGNKPAKNSKEYTEITIALDDLVKQKWWTWYPEGLELINYSIINDNNLSDTLSTSISSTMASIYSTDTLMKLLEENNYKTWPVINNLAKLNPRDADYAAIKASINQMASNIARWFWEKWVLTDKDIERYMHTIPNEKMGNKAQEVVGTLLKAKLYDWLVRTLEVQAKNKKDVSMYAAEYQEAIKWLQDNGFRTWWGRGLTGTISLSWYWRS